MTKIGLICEAGVPPGMMASVTIKEDVDRDGEYEYESTQELRDGTFVYVLDGFDGSEESSWGREISLGRDDENYNYTISDDPDPPSISYIQLILPGGALSSSAPPRRECGHLMPGSADLGCSSV